MRRLLYITRDDVDIDHEEEIRELAITQLKYYSQLAVDDILSIDQVICYFDSLSDLI